MHSEYYTIAIVKNDEYSTGISCISFASIFGNFLETFASTEPLFCIEFHLFLETKIIRKLAKPKEPVEN